MTPALDDLFVAFQTALAGRYSIDRELGRGGMGIVYLAREVHLDRPVAIKLLPPERALDATLRERFLREARLAAKLSHPNIIPIHAVDEAGDFVYYVMTYVDGESLAQRVRARGPLSATEGARVLREAAWALASAHAQGVVHRDVKPDNILIESATQRVLMADFGIAAAMGDRDGDGISGTPEFMSPEQALGHDLDARSDLYSLGATAFFAFSGRLPFEGDTPTEVLAKQVTEPAAPLASLGLPVPRKIASLVDRCLAKDPAHRPASATALAEQLGVALEQRREIPVALRAFVKRNGRLDGGGTLLTAGGLLLGSIGVSAYFGGWAGFGALLGASTLLPFAALAASARRLARMGFAHMDLAPAFQAESDATREELAVEHAREATRAERWLKRIAQVSGTAAVGSFASLMYISLGNRWVGASAQWLPTLLVSSWSVFVMGGLSYLALLQRRSDVDTGFWARLWNGPIGRAAWAVGRRFIRGPVTESAITHRATELSLGMAAENLFQGLPRATRDQLGDLPAVLHRLQDDAQQLRRHLDGLQEVLNDAGESASTDPYEPVRRDRDAMQAKLGETVAALETIRLNLLRLHAGSLSVAGLTTHIGLAADVSAEVEEC
ncbi:MAG: serine/threonine protein kinase [Gemmatimonadetes bacterium]|nr:serine/threonine protein kinase [Gemmatimonadota bacterium]